MTARLKSEIWAAAWLRRCAAQGIPAVMRRRGAPEAGAIFLRIDCLDGNSALFGPAMQADLEQQHDGRLFRRMHKEQTIPSDAAEEMIARELKFDPDLWLLEADDRQGRAFADLARE